MPFEPDLSKYDRPADALPEDEDEIPEMPDGFQEENRTRYSDEELEGLNDD